MFYFVHGELLTKICQTSLMVFVPIELITRIRYSIWACVDGVHCFSEVIAGLFCFPLSSDFSYATENVAFL